MLKRYGIWDKKSPVITPIFEVLTAEQWMERYPAARLASVTVVCSAGEVNGGFFGTMGQMEQMYSARGVDFSGCTSNEEKLQLIEDFEDLMNMPNNEASAEERIAAALEYQNLMSMEDAE